MYHIILVFLLSLTFLAFVFLIIFNIAIRLLVSWRDKKTAEYRKIIISKIESFIDGSDIEFKNGVDKFVRDLAERDKSYRDVVDDYLMYILEIPGINYRERYITIGWRLDFTSDCMEQIKNQNPEIAALGFRRAGLYSFKKAAEHMMAALDVFSSENQFEILLGLARMGEADLIQQAFEKIKDNILVNERAVIQILSSFPKGDHKLRLFRNMLRCGTDYIAAIFLKAMGSEMAVPLTEEIISALYNGNKYVRTAAVRGLSVLEKHAPLNELIMAMDDHDWEVRCMAAKALGSVFKKNATLALFRGLHDQQWWVRQNCAQSMINHPGYEPLFILTAESGDEYAKDSIIYVLEKSGNPVLLRSIKIMAA